MRVRELIAEAIWKLRFLDPFFYVFLIWMKIERAKKEEREEILRAVYDIRVKDDALAHLKKDYLVRLFMFSLIGVILLFLLFP
ncbi:MAG: hypothetical protein QXT86_11295 [Archaeoglobaceae archaeon]